MEGGRDPGTLDRKNEPSTPRQRDPEQFYKKPPRKPREIRKIPA
ncbi:hypothetical protein AKJ08_1992 [Vulgatibacter incomptus]|uniref:Uncharacterized protein n=1 Tax=Vulgatibacter incomptus TaxID=1391653 RepID=A0A0K1PDL0_9BACT|nr:hypothetical protein AKJ08_1992 [Vulgatibacter incomptus]